MIFQISDYAGAILDICSLIALLVSFLVYIKKLTKALQLVLRAQLIEMIRGHLQAGWCSPDDRAEVVTLYEAYHNTGKNGVMDDRMAQFKALPSHPESEC